MNDLIKSIFDQMEFSIILFPENKKVTIKHYEKLKELIQKEVDFWNPYNQGHLNTIRNHFLSIRGIFSNIEGNLENENYIRSYLNQIKSELTVLAYPKVFSNTACAKFLVKLYEESYDSASRAVEYLFDLGFNSLSNRRNYIGVQKAYEFDNAKTNYFLDAESIKRENLLKEFDEEYSQLINKYQDTNIKINLETQNFKDEIKDWTENQKNSLDDFFKVKKEEMEKLEVLYREKLRFESPAEYWNNLSVEYEKKGKSWKNFTLLLSFLFIILLSGILLRMPKDVFSNDIFDFNNLKITISFAFVVSVGIFLIRLFVKLTLSNYHLSTDAKERYQLTHVYLSLIKENAITDNERALVIQSIFSRSETGLIKGDSTPAFPESVVSGIISNLKK
ncbi:MAG: hypothetical protein BGO41_11680 [Clostridiales bacterium 38-18]|nr:MAG: hypothetical protein BGO41_11680 [Clostridiales bacterium 38-18]